MHATVPGTQAGDQAGLDTDALVRDLGGFAKFILHSGGKEFYEAVGSCDLSISQPHPPPITAKSKRSARSSPTLSASPCRRQPSMDGLVHSDSSPAREKPDRPLKTVGPPSSDRDRDRGWSCASRASPTREHAHARGARATRRRLAPSSRARHRAAVPVAEGVPLECLNASPQRTNVVVTLAPCAFAMFMIMLDNRRERRCRRSRGHRRETQQTRDRERLHAVIRRMLVTGGRMGDQLRRPLFVPREPVRRVERDDRLRPTRTGSWPPRGAGLGARS